jgi:type IV pilus assembly protein PilE
VRRAFASRTCGGFTLAELLIVMAVLAILSTLAYAIYLPQVLKSHRNDVQADMSAMAQQFERCRTRSNAYNECGLVSTYNNQFSDSERYQFEVSAGQREFSIRAVPQSTGSQNRDKCQTLTLNHLGIRDTTADGLDASDCW